MAGELVSDVDRVRRWEDSGGRWQVLAQRDHAVTVSLCRCDGGEEADRLTSTDPDLLAFLGGRQSSDD